MPFRRASRAAAAALVVAALTSWGTTPATAADTTITFSGHGWGHGRGMGQYGALGYAVKGMGYRDILQHYYGGTTVGTSAAPELTVELTALTSKNVVIAGTDLYVNGVPVGAGDSAVKAVAQTNGSVLLYKGAGCQATTWTPMSGSYTANSLELWTASAADTSKLVRVCESTGERFYRGILQVRLVNGQQMTFNRVTTQDYLRGVVPRESPASWGSVAGGLGMQALMAQAVAARSYALSGSRSSGATTCDTTACQVYAGAGTRPFGGAISSLEASQSDQAVAATAGEVRLGPANQVMRTEFSSSTGGWTAGGTFPAVQDDGDAYASNPYHDWTTSIPVATVQSALGVGTISSLTVTSRNGLGADGGRVLQVSVVGSSGSKTMTGDQVRSALGLRSDWFTISWISPATARSVVTALYTDLLGRGPDPTGLAGWSSALQSGTDQATLVLTLTQSDEYIGSRVAKAYREVLGREPEPVGADAWLRAIKAHQTTVDDVQRRFYDSDEYFAASGGTWEGYVRRLYTTMLRRDASDAEVRNWVSLVGSQGRAWVVDSIWWSLEAANVRAGDYYRTFLGREADPTGRGAWAQVLLTYGEGAVRAGIAGSMEYRSRAIARFP